MTVIKKLTAALLCLCTLLLCACAGEEQEPDEQHQLKLWYVESAPMAENLVQLIEEFNASSSGYKVVPRAFESEQKLAAAFDSGHPDLLLCGHERAFALYEQDKLTDISSALGEDAPEFLSGVDIRSASGAAISRSARRRSCCTSTARRLTRQRPARASAPPSSGRSKRCAPSPRPTAAAPASRS